MIELTDYRAVTALLALFGRSFFRRVSPHFADVM